MKAITEKQKGFTFLALLVLIGVLLFAIWYLNSPFLEGGLYINVNQLSAEQEQDLIDSGQRHLIEISPQGFIPEHLRVQQFDTITFRNLDQEPHRPSSESGNCAAISSPRPLNPSESYSFVLSKTGECPFRDLLSSFPSGEIRVSRRSAE